jgi:restriction endonuclease S subunit
LLGTSTSGNYGTSTSGNYGTSTSGYKGTSTSGNYGTSISGKGGTSTSGKGGTIIIKWYNKEEDRYMLAIGYVGKNGIKPNVPYICNENRELVEKK